MQHNVFKNYTELSQATADIVIELVKAKPTAVVCMASGDTPRLTCQLLAEKVVSEKIDFSQFTFIGLDEWVGIPPTNEGSCRYFFETLLARPLKLSPSQVHLFNALSTDLPGECKAMDNIIAEKGGIDLIIVGIGMNGHIGFNEPGVPFDSYAQVVDLDEITISVGQKYFKESVKLKQGITLGLQHLLNAKKAIIIANGSKKAAVIKQAAEGEVSNQFPATIIQKHRNGFIMTDEEAAAQLSK